MVTGKKNANKASFFMVIITEKAVREMNISRHKISYKSRNEAVVMGQMLFSTEAEMWYNFGRLILTIAAVCVRLCVTV